MCYPLVGKCLAAAGKLDPIASMVVRNGLSVQFGFMKVVKSLLWDPVDKVVHKVDLIKRFWRVGNNLSTRV